MKAITYDEASQGTTSRGREIPRDLQRPGQARRASTWSRPSPSSTSELLDRYLHEQPYDAEDLRRALRKGTLLGAIHPVLCGSAYRNKGVQRLLDAVVDLLPSPLDMPPVEGHTTDTWEHVTRRPDDAEPFAALAFKIATDPYVGKLTFFRVYSGARRARATRS